MSQSSFIAGMLLFGFILYLSAQNRLTVYTAVLWGNTAAASSSATASKSGSGNIASSVASSAASSAGKGILDFLKSSVFPNFGF